MTWLSPGVALTADGVSGQSWLAGEAVVDGLADSVGVGVGVADGLGEVEALEVGDPDGLGLAEGSGSDDVGDGLPID